MSPLKAGKSPNEQLSLTNRIALNPRDHDAFGKARHLSITLPSQHKYIFTVEAVDSMPAGQVGFSAVHRKWGEDDIKTSPERWFSTQRLNGL